MLRIQRSEEPDRVVFTLSGRIEETHLVELENLLRSETRAVAAIDLSEVRLVDGEAVRFLAHCENKGIALQGCSAYIREWMGAESRESHEKNIGMDDF